MPGKRIDNFDFVARCKKFSIKIELFMAAPSTSEGAHQYSESQKRGLYYKKKSESQLFATESG
jgi:hypothetical protein